MNATGKHAIQHKDVIQKILSDFATTNPTVSLALLTTSDGFEVAAYPGKEAMSARLAAMSSSLQALADVISREAGLKNSRDMIIQAEGGAILVLGIPNAQPPMALAVVGSSGMTLGHMLWAARNCCKSLDAILQP